MHLQYAIFGLGTPEVVLIVILGLVLFGGKKIPELMRGLGEGVREFNSAKANMKQEIEQGMREKPVPPVTTKEPVTEEKKAS